MTDSSPNPNDADHIERCSPLDPDAPMTELSVEEAEAMPDAKGVIQSGKLAGRSMWSAIWILALPVLVQQMAAAFLGLADKIIAGSLPEDIVVPALDGLGIGSYIGWFIGIAMTGLGIGGQALIARAMGSGNAREAHAALGQAMALSALWGACVGVLLWFAAPWLGQTCKLSDEALFYCVRYIRVLSLSMPACGVMMVGSMSLHGAGETTKPSVIAVLVNVVNVVFSWSLSGAEIRVGEQRLPDLFNFDLDVTGIAIGTALSYIVGAILIVWVLRRGVKDLRLESADLKPDGSMIIRLIRIGIPSFLEGISMWAVNLFVLMIIGEIGKREAVKAAEAAAEQAGTVLDAGAKASSDIAQVAGEGLQGVHIIAVQWEAFSFLPGFAIGIAAGALAGQYLGAGNARMAQKAVLVCTSMAVVVMGVMGVIFMLFGEQLTYIISKEPVHLKHVPELLWICGMAQVFFAITMVVRQGLRGVGDTTWALIITTVSSYGARLPAAWYLGIHLDMGIEGVWWGLCGEFFVRAALFCMRFFHGGWKKLKV